MKGVSSIQKVGIVHRDLKHLNILITIIDGKPVPKITDFGMAAKLRGSETITRLAGTIGFMAPEVMLDQPSDFKADVWSLGVILFALVSSGVPFAGRSRDETAYSIVNDALTFK